MSYLTISRAGVLAGLALAASPAQAVDQTGSGRAIVLNPVAFLSIEDLDFGTVLAPNSGTGTVWINPTDNSMSYTGGVQALLSGTPHRGYFIGSADPGADILVTATLPTRLYRNGDIAQSWIPINMQLDHIGSSSGQYFYVGKSNRTFTVFVGGTLSIPAGSQSGPYSNMFSITAEHL